MTGSEGVSIQIQHENNFDCSLLDSFGSFISLASVYVQKLNRNSTVSITRNIKLTEFIFLTHILTEVFFRNESNHGQYLQINWRGGSNVWGAECRGGAV